MSASAKLICVDPNRVDEFWPHVEPLLRPAMVRCGEMTMRDLHAMLSEHRALLWIVWDGSLSAAVVTQVAQTIKGRVCVIVALGGRSRNNWLHLIEDLEDYAVLENCTAMRIYGREGWKRVLPDYRQTRVILEKEIG